MTTTAEVNFSLVFLTETLCPSPVLLPLVLTQLAGSPSLEVAELICGSVQRLFFDKSQVDAMLTSQCSHKTSTATPTASTTDNTSTGTRALPVPSVNSTWSECEATLFTPWMLIRTAHDNMQLLDESISVKMARGGLPAVLDEAWTACDADTHVATGSTDSAGDADSEASLYRNRIPWFTQLHKDGQCLSTQNNSRRESSGSSGYDAASGARVCDCVSVVSAVLDSIRRRMT
jgi:hypothetical protein